MADSLADPIVEAEMKKIKSILDDVNRHQNIFTNTFSTMPPKEKAETVKKIRIQHKSISDFIEGAKKYDLRAPALKFGLENIKQKYQMIMTLWRRTEKMLESGSGSGGQGKPIEKSSSTDNAVTEYERALRNLGHSPTAEMISEFKNRLDSAYQKAKEKSGGRDLNVHIVEEGGKIKVRMEPK